VDGIEDELRENRWSKYQNISRYAPESSMQPVTGTTPYPAAGGPVQRALLHRAVKATQHLHRVQQRFAWPEGGGVRFENLAQPMVRERLPAAALKLRANTRWPQEAHHGPLCFYRVMLELRAKL